MTNLIKKRLKNDVKSYKKKSDAFYHKIHVDLDLSELNFK